MESRSIDGRG